MAATEVMESWCPKKVSMVDRVERDWRARCREREEVRMWCEGLLSGGIAMPLDVSDAST
jgi:hypothetical protein